MPNASPARAEDRRVGSPGYWERRLVPGLMALTLLLTSLPYILGYWATPPGMRFIGTAYNIDDFCNYLSWLRQNADGYFFYHNLFTTDPQKNLEFNLFFYALGRLMYSAHLSPQAVWQMARVGGGVALLWLIYRFYRHCLPDDRPARLTAFGFVCLGSGFGWMQAAKWQDKNVHGSPVDAWQPEAFTFLSLYTSALFVVSTLLILATLFALLRGEETGQWRYAIWAGVFGAILGNMHSYDVLHLSCAWGLFLIIWTILRRGRGVALSWGRGLLALALTAPTTLYQLYIFNAEATFHKRANVPTLSPAFWHYIFGYGLVFLLALVAIIGLLFPVVTVKWVRRASARINLQNDSEQYTDKIILKSRPLIFVICWAIGGFAAAYLPFAFQRKMLMGEHIPLCLLAGWGASLVPLLPAILRAWKTDRKFKNIAWTPARVAVLALLVLATFPSNALFLRRDIRHLESDHSETGLSPFVPNTLFDAFGWIRSNLSPRNDAILGFPTNCAYLPGATDHVVWCGHWAETPDYAKKIAAIARFADANTSDDERRAFLAGIPVTYLIYPNDVSHPYIDKHGQQHHFADFGHQPPPYLQPTYANSDFTVFHIDLSPGVHP